MRNKLLCSSVKTQSHLSVVSRWRGEKLDTSFSHCTCSGNYVFCVQPNVLDSWGPVLLQEGVHLISA